MDSIINKLTEIESAASAIVQHAEAEKSALDEKFDKKRTFENFRYFSKELIDLIFNGILTSLLNK